MSKVGGALPSWFWPEGVPRRVSVPQQPLERLLRRQMSATPDQPAVLSVGGSLTYGTLLDRSLTAAAGIQSRDPGLVVAISERDPVEALILFLAGVFAGRQVLVCDLGHSLPALTAQLSDARTTIVLTTTGAGPIASAPGVEILTADQLTGVFSESAKPRRATDAAVLIAAERGIVQHSHFALSAMCTSLFTFIPILRESTFVSAVPLGTWEGLCGTLGALLNGRTIATLTPDDVRAGRYPGVQEESYTILRRADVEEFLRHGGGSPLLQQPRYLFVSTGPFSSKWRRQLERRSRRSVYPLWGTPEVGPVVAPHPTWFPRDAHGFPLVNVSLHPIDPTTGKVCIVPWEMLDSAEIGIESLSAMTGYTDPARNAAMRIGKVIRTHQVAGIDHVGVVTLLAGHHTGKAANAYAE